MKKNHLAILPCFMHAVSALSACSAGPLTITAQPQSVTVNYPEGAAFSVTVSDPKNVESYQWILVDRVGNEFELQGITAKTSELVIPSTEKRGGQDELYCIIRDRQGNELVSERARLDVGNEDVNKPVFYVGEYAVEPGETLDLSEVDMGDGTKLGSGTVAFDAGGTDLVITDLVFDNTYFTCDQAISPNVGLCMVYDSPEVETYNVTFNGENRIMNNYFDPDYNAAGIPFDFYLTGSTKKPEIRLVGDGTLEITNGSNALRVIGDLMVGIDITVKQTRKNYGDGIVAENMLISEGTKLDLEVFGSALYAGGNLFIDGADVTIDANAPHISVGIATKNILQSGNIVNITGSKVDIRSHADPDVTNGIAGLKAVSANADMYITDSEVSYTADALAKDTVYASNFIGFDARTIDVDRSRLKMNVDCADIYSIFGIYAEDYVLFENSEAEFDLKTSGQVYGIAPEGDFSSDESSVTVRTDKHDKYDAYGAFIPYGIMCGSFVMKSSDPDKKVSSRAEKGMALGVNLNDSRDEPAAYTEGYTAQNIFMRDDSACLLPEDAVFSTGSVPAGDDIYRYYLWVETVYDRTDTSEPAEEVVFGIR